MKEYEIKIEAWNEDDLQEVKESIADSEEFAETLQFLEKLPCTIKISTLEEYFNLMGMVSNATEGEFKIYNDGRLFVLWGY